MGQRRTPAKHGFSDLGDAVSERKCVQSGAPVKRPFSDIPDISADGKPRQGLVTVKSKIIDSGGTRQNCIGHQLIANIEFISILQRISPRRKFNLHPLLNRSCIIYSFQIFTLVKSVINPFDAITDCNTLQFFISRKSILVYLCCACQNRIRHKLILNIQVCVFQKMCTLLELNLYPIIECALITNGFQICAIDERLINTYEP